MPPRALPSLLLLAFCLLFTAPAFSQVPAPAASTPASTTATETTPNLRALLDTLSNDATRKEFLDKLRALVDSGAVAEEPVKREDWLSGATESLGAFSGAVLGILSEIETLPTEAMQLFENLTDPFVLQRIGWAVSMVIAVLVAAIFAEYAAKWLLSRPRRAIEARATHSFIAKLLMLIMRTILDVVPIAVFAAVAYGVLALVELSFIVRLAVVTVINANVLARLVIVAARAVLTPDAPQMRLFRLDNESAAYGYLWVRRFTHTAIYGYFILRAAWVLGLSRAAYVFFGDLLALLLAGMSVVLILQVRNGVGRRLRRLGSRDSKLARVRDTVAEFWHVLMIAYISVAYLVWVLDIGRGFDFLARATLLSILAVTIATLVGMGLIRAFDRVFRLNPELHARFPLLEVRANRYIPILRTVLKWVFIAFVLLVLLEIWGAQPFVWLASESGQGLVGRMISIGIVLVIGLVLWEIAAAFAERLRLTNPNSTRLKTLLPFVQNAFRVVLLTLGGLILLSEVGVDIAPLLAGAGVLGLAIGFGAQTLVKDVITGVFILMEDTLSVGDVVEVGTHAGLVEKITIRTVHMRDFDGNVHSIPFGEVQTIKNMSKDFAYAVVDVDIAYRENIDDALALMAEVAADMASKGPLAETIVEPFEVVGVEGLKESSVWLRGRFKTRPLGQWNVKREFYRRIKAAFEAKGIEIPFPHRTIYMGSDKKGLAAPLRVVNQRPEDIEMPARRRADAARAARTPGPLIEEHPGARERSDDEDGSMLPTIEEKDPS
ncbi:mechanosensitive ion channel domain-containing protein [Ancylobacter mangrovi]|uniref:mechanosensitive ion channel domain-containing protein n=1 Tax=Ancylobacter mangrovi TaxID=2972472 RepID=UPI0021610DFA|nr:mechanosensitive ion channel domain-containing protein [Ancylobacter mangrovi]MCS0500879.1 mechanosensitive ion channel [Ancylobacter mangrovi]